MEKHQRDILYELENLINKEVIDPVLKEDALAAVNIIIGIPVPTFEDIPLLTNAFIALYVLAETEIDAPSCPIGQLVHALAEHFDSIFNDTRIYWFDLVHDPRVPPFKRVRATRRTLES